MTRAEKILRALKAEPGTCHHTEYYARQGRCSLAEAVVELQRIERAHPERIRRSRSYAGMTWGWSR